MKKLICMVIVLAVLAAVFTAVAEERQMFIFCNPKTPVIIRKTPRKGSEESGRLDFGDWVITDGVKKNGFLHVVGVTESGEGWIFAGYVIEDQPVRMEKARANIGATGRVMSYRWVNGKKNGWLQVCEEVKVYGWSEEWAVTDKGYIRTKYLEVWYE